MTDTCGHRLVEKATSVSQNTTHRTDACPLMESRCGPREAEGCRSGTYQFAGQLPFGPKLPIGSPVPASYEDDH